MLAKSKALLVTASFPPHLEPVIVRTKRRTLAISVHPNGTVEVRAPMNSTDEEIQEKIRKRRLWILKQLRQFAAQGAQVAPRRYVSGESHRYLGKQYRLKVQNGDLQEVKLAGGYIRVSATDKSPRKVQSLLEHWYADRALFFFRKRILVIARRLKLKAFDKSRVRLRKMKFRWGSCTPRGLIYLNRELIKAPATCIDYVIIHELCHLREPNHGKHFYRLLETALPSWRNFKHRLEVGQA